MKKIITLALLINLAYSETCNIKYYKMMSNRDDIMALKQELKTEKYKTCTSRSDCKISIKSLEDLDRELTSKYYACKNGE